MFMEQSAYLRGDPTIQILALCAQARNYFAVADWPNTLAMLSEVKVSFPRIFHKFSCLNLLRIFCEFSMGPLSNFWKKLSHNQMTRKFIRRFIRCVNGIFTEISQVALLSSGSLDAAFGEIIYNGIMAMMHLKMNEEDMALSLADHGLERLSNAEPGLFLCAIGYSCITEVFITMLSKQINLNNKSHAPGRVSFRQKLVAKTEKSLELLSKFAQVSFFGIIFHNIFSLY